MIELPWAEFKEQVLDTGFWTWIYFDVNSHYKIYAKQNDFNIVCNLYQDAGANVVDFETNYKDNAATEIISRTQGRFERDDIVLKLARCAGTADLSGDLVISLVVPGDAGEITRYTAGGYAYVETYAWTDALTKVEVVDVDNVFGLGAGTVLKTYHDTEVDTVNQGWFFERSYGAEGNVDLEPMGWYGEFRGGLTLRLTFKVTPLKRVKCLLWWGKIE